MSQSREHLLSFATAPRAVEPVQAGPWGTVHVRALSGAEYDEYETACVTKVGKRLQHKTNRAVLARLAVCDEAGRPLFTKADDEALAKLTVDILNPIAAAALRLAGLGKGDDAGND